MKKITVSKQFLTLFFLSGIILSSFAQDLYLPATTNSKDVKALYLKAMDAMFDIDFVAAFDYAQQAIDAEPDFFMGHYLKTYSDDKATKNAAVDKIVSYSGKMNKGEEVLKDLITQTKNNPEYSSVDAFRQLVKLYPKCVFPKMLLAYNLNYDSATKGEAYTVLDEIIRMAPEVASAYNLRGYMYLSDNEYTKALEAFDRYIEMDPEQANPYDSKGDYFMAVKQYDDAAQSFYKAYDMNNNFGYSKTKGEQAKWMAKRELIAKDVLKAADKMVADYNSMDVKQYVSNYINSPELSYLSDGNLVTSYAEIAKIISSNRTKYAKWFVTVEQTNIEIPDEKIAVLTQKYKHESTSVDGENMIMGGFYTSIWRKGDKGWKIINVIDVTTEE